jgi:uncharacterized small protein (DUF1192 family)
LPNNDGQGEHLAQTVTEVSERMTLLVREEIELAKAEVSVKAKSLGRGAGAVAAGSVFGFFAVIFFLLTLAWLLDAILVDGAGDIWIGFGIVFLLLLILAVAAFLGARRLLSVGAPAPTMAIEEAKLIKETVSPNAGTQV